MANKGFSINLNINKESKNKSEIYTKLVTNQEKLIFSNKYIKII